MKHRLSNLWKQLHREKWLFLLCFLLAFFAWQLIRRNISLPLPVSNIPVDIEVPEGWAVLDKSLDTVDVRFMGSREDIRDLNSGTLRVVIPIQNPERGEDLTYTFLTKFVKNNPTDAKVQRFNPSEIKIRLDEEQEKRLSVKAAYNGTLPDGIEIERINYTPATVLVRGARQQIELMEDIRTVPIELKNRQATFKENIRIDLPQGSGLQAEPDRVSVEFVLAAHRGTTTIDNLPVHVMFPPGETRAISIQPQTVNVTVQGPQQRIEQLRMTDLSAFVNCTELTESSVYEVAVNINLPTGLQVVTTDPLVVEVRIGSDN